MTTTAQPPTDSTGRLVQLVYIYLPQQAEEQAQRILADLVRALLSERIEKILEDDRNYDWSFREPALYWSTTEERWEMLGAVDIVLAADHIPRIGDTTAGYPSWLKNAQVEDGRIYHLSGSLRFVEEFGLWRRVK